MVFYHVPISEIYKFFSTRCILQYSNVPYFSPGQHQVNELSHLESNGIENKDNEGVGGNEQENNDTALNLCTMSPKGTINS